MEFHYTPKPGSWLTRAEGEFAALTKQCLARRVPDVTTLRREIAAWQARRNRAKPLITWRFGTSDARVKLFNETHDLETQANEMCEFGVDDLASTG